MTDSKKERRATARSTFAAIDRAAADEYHLTRNTEQRCDRTALNKYVNIRDLAFATLNETLALINEEAVAKITPVPDFTGQALWGANFSYANLTGANMEHTHMSGADFWYADLREANLREANLSGAAWDKTTVWPEGIGPLDKETA